MRRSITRNWDGIIDRMNGAERYEEDEENNSYQREMVDLIRFVTEKCENSDFPLNITQLGREYRRKSRSTIELRCLIERIKKYRQEIRNFDQIELNTRARQMFVLSGFVDSEFLEKLQKEADVKVDEKGRIIEYTSKDGTLKLAGQHHNKTESLKTSLKRKFNDSEDASRSSKGADHTPLLKILEALRTLILTLDLKSLETIQKKIEVKMKESRESMTSIEGFLIALKSMYLMITINEPIGNGID